MVGIVLVHHDSVLNVWSKNAEYLVAPLCLIQERVGAMLVEEFKPVVEMILDVRLDVSSAVLIQKFATSHLGQTCIARSRCHPHRQSTCSGVSTVVGDVLDD